MAVLGKVKEIFSVLSDSKYIPPKTLGLIRHIFGVVGTILVFTGVTSQDQVTIVSDSILDILTRIDVIIGDLLLAISFVSSWFAKEKNIK